MTAILLWLSFPSVVVGNLLFVVVVLFRNNRSRIKTFRDDNNNNAGRSFGNDNNNNAGRQNLGNDKEKQYLKTDKSYILQIAAMPLPAGQ